MNNRKAPSLIVGAKFRHGQRGNRIDANHQGKGCNKLAMIRIPQTVRNSLTGEKHHHKEQRAENDYCQEAIPEHLIFVILGIDETEKRGLHSQRK